MALRLFFGIAGVELSGDSIFGLPPSIFKNLFIIDPEDLEDPESFSKSLIDSFCCKNVLPLVSSDDATT